MATGFWEHFSVLSDPRVERIRLHKLQDILTIALCAFIGGADNWVDIVEFGRAKEGLVPHLPGIVPRHPLP